MSELPLIGYCDPLTVVPGEQVRFMVSSQHPRFEASIVRLIHGDPNPEGPGFKAEPVQTSVQGEYPGREQPLRGGSYIVVPYGEPLSSLRSFTIQMWICPTTPEKGLQGLFNHWDDSTGEGYGLFIGEHGGLELWLGGDSGPVSVRKFSSGAPLRAREWYFVAASYDADEGQAGLFQAPLRQWPEDATRANLLEQSWLTLKIPNGRPVMMAMALIWDRDGALVPAYRYNGKIDSPRLFAQALTPEQLTSLANDDPPGDVDGALVAAWDFSRDMGASRVSDAGPHGLHGETVQVPARGMTGHNWKGRETDFTQVPGQYGAIHFHDDDLADAEWESGFSLEVPQDLPSGIYAAWVRAGDDEDYIPFFVRPPRGTKTASAAFLIPTNSYLAYANEKIWLPTYLAPNLVQDQENAATAYCKANGLHSLYDVHGDRSGVCYSSRLRPIVNLKPKVYAPFLDCPHQFAADLHLEDWLHAMNFDHDIITDEALHEEGLELLSAYRVILTGSHPEYWTDAMMTAMEAYLAGGGRLMYLGGNGFYWVTSIDAANPHLIEVRRFSGVRAWQAEPGEYHLNTTGEMGGLWRDRGRAPQRMCGVGFTAQGFDVSAPYRRREESHDARASFIFEGIAADEPIGDFPSLVLKHGAAGFELDRMDKSLGTPHHALHLAASGGHSDSYQHSVEEVLTSNSRQGGTVNRRVRADMVYFEGPHDGAVFSTGSIAWCGALSHNEYDNTVSKVTANVLTRFLRAGPLV